MAADAGNATAMRNIGNLHADGGIGERDYRKAELWWTRAAESGDKDAMFNLGSMFVKDDQTLPDYLTAAKWFAEGAKVGDSGSMRELGKIYEEGGWEPRRINFGEILIIV